jgi:NADH-ubiquinone oxidoreductase chain 5
MVINRVGDFGFFLGILSTFFIFKTLDFYNVFLLVPYLKYQNLLFLGFCCNSLNVIASLFFIGAVGKSAQVGLHTWLPDAMEGPTPVSALIHAATMVTAGVFLIIRCSVLFEYAPVVLMACVFIGAVTAFFAATAGILQNDVKKVIAYSTCSQLGYMLFACGLSNYTVSFFHLFNHAFFKALLFLAAGSLIHSLSNEQDMRNMGGFVRLLPYTYTIALIGSFALMGFPFLSGFYSKDIIMEVALINYTIAGKFAYILGTISAFFTSFYSFRVLFLVFIKPNNSFKFFIKNLHELDKTVAFVLTILAFGSIFSGYLFKDLFIGLGSDFFNFSIYIRPNNLTTIDSEFIPHYLKLIPTLFSLIGAVASGIIYCILYKHTVDLNLTKRGLKIYKFLNQKWYFDFIYNKVIVIRLLGVTYNFIFKGLDKGILELLGPRGVSFTFFIFMHKFKTHQTGFLYHYTCMLLIGYIFLTYFLI